MRPFPIPTRVRNASGILLCCTTLWGCAGSSTSVAPADTGTVPPPPVSQPAPPPSPRPEPAPSETASTDEELDLLMRASVTALDPQQGIEQQSIGKRVRWAGAVLRTDQTERGTCLTVLYARSNEYGGPGWSNDSTGQVFEACVEGAYDTSLVREHTNITLIGRISGNTRIGLGGGHRTGAVIQIDRLFRWSDCLAGDPSPECRVGFLSPQPR